MCDGHESDQARTEQLTIASASARRSIIDFLERSARAETNSVPPIRTINSMIAFDMAYRCLCGALTKRPNALRSSCAPALEAQQFGAAALRRHGKSCLFDVRAESV